MGNFRIGLNLVTLRDGREAGRLGENLDRVSSAGFQGVGLWVSTIEQWLEAGRTVEQLAGEVQARGLEVHELCFTRVLDDDGRVADASEVFGWARTLGAPAMITIYNSGQADRPQAQSDWSAFVRNIEKTGVAAAFEFIGPAPQYNSPLRAWEVIQAGPELGTMVFDTFHFWRGGGDLSQIGQVPAGRVSLVHLNDCNDVPRDQAADADRTYPGEGVMPLPDMLGALIAAGFAGPFSVEIFGAVQEQDPDEVAAQAYRSAASLLAAL